MRSAPFLNLPNSISLSRVMLAVAFILLGTDGRVVVLALATASDFLDGWIARRFNTVTRSGALVDAVTDRTFVLAAVTTFVAERALSGGQAIVLISRDLATTGAFFLARGLPQLRAATFQARWPGKVATALQLTVLFSVLLRPAFTGSLIAATGVASAAAIADYTVALWRARSPA